MTQAATVSTRLTAAPGSIERPQSRPPHIVARMFNTPLNALLSVMFIGGLVWALPGLFRWFILNAAILPAEPKTCQATPGACWSFVIAKSGQILFGIYPPDERWRPALVCLLILGLLGWSVRPKNWNGVLLLMWAATLTLVVWLMGGGYGLAPVPTSSWGGLPVTLILTVVAIGFAFPISIFLALGRRSEMPVVSVFSVIFIETIRGLPLLSILFVASIMLPLFVPEALLPDKFMRALIALTLFASAYLAEVIRGGLQAVPRGQYEGAKALGLGYWRMQRLVILPQAIRIVIPALANTIIVMVKNTSLVLVVGLFDLISSGKAAFVGSGLAFAVNRDLSFHRCDLFRLVVRLCSLCRFSGEAKQKRTLTGACGARSCTPNLSDAPPLERGWSFRCQMLGVDGVSARLCLAHFSACQRNDPEADDVDTRHEGKDRPKWRKSKPSQDQANRIDYQRRHKSKHQPVANAPADHPAISVITHMEHCCSPCFNISRNG